jgi:hypothetical protein
MAVENASPSVREMLSDATTKISQSHWLLSGIVDAAVHPKVRPDAQESLDAVADAIVGLREVAVALQESPIE